MNLDFAFYFAVFLRRIHYFILITVVVSAAAIAAAFLLPPTYSASTSLVVESSQIPNAMAAPTVQTAAMETLQIIEQRLMTRTNLLDIAKKTKAFREIEKMNPDDIVTAMRDATTINKRAAKGEATSMTMTFQSPFAPVTAAVLNEFVTLILSENVALRTERAGQTMEFFQQEVDRLSGELDQLSSKLLDFQTKNADALPATLQYRMTQQSMLQGQISTADSAIATLKEQKDQLIAVFRTTGQVGNTPGVQKTPEQVQLENERQNLTQALAVFSEDNPKVKMIKSRITQLEEIVRAQVPGGITAAPADPAQSMLDLQVQQIDTRIKAEEEKKRLAEEQLVSVTEAINRTPANQVSLDALNRDYQNAQTQFNNAVQRLAQAATGERIELLSKGERVSVIDAAVVPQNPIKPNRIMIAGGGIGAGVFLGLAFVVLIELLNRSVRRPKDLIRSFGITPLTSIPYVRTPYETVMRRSVFSGLLLATVTGIPAAIYAVHVYYQPLDLLLSQFAENLGLSL
ncbi:MAG: GumC family protein [Paracoccaceae bacterium]